MKAVQDGVHKSPDLLAAEQCALAAEVELRIHMMRGRLKFCPSSDTSPSAKELERVRLSTQQRAIELNQ